MEDENMSKKQNILLGEANERLAWRWVGVGELGWRWFLITKMLFTSNSSQRVGLWTKLCGNYLPPIKHCQKETSRKRLHVICCLKRLRYLNTDLISTWKKKPLGWTKLGIQCFKNVRLWLYRNNRLALEWTIHWLAKLWTHQEQARIRMCT